MEKETFWTKVWNKIKEIWIKIRYYVAAFFAGVGAALLGVFTYNRGKNRGLVTDKQLLETTKDRVRDSEQRVESISDRIGESISRTEDVIRQSGDVEDLINKYDKRAKETSNKE